MPERRNVVKKLFLPAFLFLLFAIMAGVCSCANSSAPSTSSTLYSETSVITVPETVQESETTPREKEDSVEVSEISNTRTSVSFYDKTIDDTISITVTLPEEFDSSVSCQPILILGRRMCTGDFDSVFSLASSHGKNMILVELSFPGSSNSEDHETRNFLTDPEPFIRFLRETVLVWLSENYSVDTDLTMLVGNFRGGYLATYDLLTEKTFSEYLIVNPTLEKKTDTVDILTREETLSASGKTGLNASVCIVRTDDNGWSRSFSSTVSFIEAIKTGSYDHLALEDILIEGQGHETFWTEALLQGLCRLNGWEYTGTEAGLVSSSKQLSEIERNSITFGLLSSEHEYYQGTIETEPAAAEYIQELSIYDEEIDDTFIVHISLPPDYDPEQKYPLLMMTDGIWRLGDHVTLRSLMTEGKMEPVIVVSVGYPNDYAAGTIRERDFLDQPDLFLQFLVENLLPVLNENYSIDTENTTLTGHSYGGCFMLYSLMHNDTIGRNTFENYCIASPITDQTFYNGRVSYFEELYYARNSNVFPVNLYFTVGEMEGTAFIGQIEDLMSALEQRNYLGLSMKYDLFEGVYHNDVFWPTIQNAAVLFYGTGE